MLDESKLPTERLLSSRPKVDKQVVDVANSTTPLQHMCTRMVDISPSGAGHPALLVHGPQGDFLGGKQGLARERHTPRAG